MSSAVSYAIKSGSTAAKNTKYSQISENETKIKKARDFGSVSFGFLFSILYVAVACNFYFNLTRVEEITRDNCTAIYAQTLEWNLNNFCEHLITWKTCAILGMVVPGLLYMVLGLLTLRELSKNHNEDATESSDNKSQKPACRNVWNTFDFLSKIVTIAITCVLLSSKAHSTQIGNSSGLKTAAIVYMVVAGAELISIVLMTIAALTCALCTAVVCCGICCSCGCCSCGKKDEESNPEAEINKNSEHTTE